MTDIFCIGIIILITGLIIFYCKKNCGVAVYNRGYGDNSDSVASLLDRIDWSNHYKGRIDTITRDGIFALLSSLLILTVVYNSIPPLTAYLQTVFLVFILSRAFYNYFQYHSEKFAHYAIERNLKFLRKKLKVKKGKADETKYKTFSGASSCWNFNYRA